MKTYFIGTKLSKNKKTVYLDIARSIDGLSCEIYDYFGERETTRKQLDTNKYDFLAFLKTFRPGVYSQCTKIRIF